MSKRPTLSKKLVKKYFTKLDHLDDLYHKAVYHLEEALKIESGIPEIQFFGVEGCIVGIGTTDRKMKLIHREK